MFAEIAELFLCKIFQIVIKFMNRNKLLSQRQHKGLDQAQAFNLEGSLFVAEQILRNSDCNGPRFFNLHNGVTGPFGSPLLILFMGSSTSSFEIFLFVEFGPVLRCF